MLEPYYQEELQSLRELGKEFAEAHPALAGLLAHGSADPDVERLLQGFAFLAGRIRRRLDDDYPEIVATLMELVCPHYLRPMPSFVMLEFKARPGTLKNSQTIPSGVEVLSKRVEGARCAFRTTSEFELAPISLENAELVLPAGSRPRIELTLRPGPKLILGECLPGALRLHLHGDLARSAELHRVLTSEVVAVWATPAGSKQPRVSLGDRPLEARGFEPGEALLPRSLSALPAQWLAQEYFAFPQKFLFAQLAGLEPLRAPAFDEGAVISIELRDAPSGFQQISADEVRLHCVPAVNLFSADAQPIRSQPGRSRYRLRPEEPQSRVIYSVDRVSGLQNVTARDVEYPSYLRAAAAAVDQGRLNGYYQIETEPADSAETPETYLRFLRSDGASHEMDTDVISISLTASNGNLPESLVAGDVSQAGRNCPEFATVRNLERPSRTARVPLGRGLHRRLIAHLSLGCEPLLSVRSLREVLQLYDFPGLRSVEARKQNARRIEGIVGVQARRADRLVEGCLIDGVEVQLDVRASNFAGLGDLYLLASVLDRLLGLHVSVNRFTQLVVREMESERTWTWPPRSGQQSIL